MICCFRVAHTIRPATRVAKTRAQSRLSSSCGAGGVGLGKAGRGGGVICWWGGVGGRVAWTGGLGERVWKGLCVSERGGEPLSLPMAGAPLWPRLPRCICWCPSSTGSFAHSSLAACPSSSSCCLPCPRVCRAARALTLALRLRVRPASRVYRSAPPVRRVSAPPE